MKILFVHETYSALAGAEMNILITGEALKNKGHDIHFLFGRNNQKDEQLFDAIFSRHQLDFDNTTTIERKEKINTLLDTIKPDIIYVHKNTDLFLLEELFNYQKPMVRMTHDHDTYCLRSYRYNYFTRLPCRRKTGLYCLFPCLGFISRNRGGLFPIKCASLQKKLREIEINKKFNLIFVVTNYMKEEFTIQGFDENKIKIFPPIPKPQSENFESNFSDKNIIIYAGQIIRGKGVDCLIKAMSKIKTKYQLLIIGSGSHEHTCKKLTAKLELEEKIKFLGWVKQDELKEYFKEATAVVVPSVWPEPIATVGLEVGRYSLPVVAFDAGGISDWLKNGENGFLINWMDIDGMSTAIETLLEDKKLAKEMGRIGKKLVNQNYDFNHYINRMEKTFTDLTLNKF